MQTGKLQDPTCNGRLCSLCWLCRVSGIPEREAPHRLTASLAQALQVNDDGQNERNENDVRGLRHKLVCRPESRAGQGDAAQHRPQTTIWQRHGSGSLALTQTLWSGSRWAPGSLHARMEHRPTLHRCCTSWSLHAWLPAEKGEATHAAGPAAGPRSSWRSRRPLQAAPGRPGTEATRSMRPACTPWAGTPA